MKKFVVAMLLPIFIIVGCSKKEDVSNSKSDPKSVAEYEESLRKNLPGSGCSTIEEFNHALGEGAKDCNDLKKIRNVQSGSGNAVNVEDQSKVSQSQQQEGFKIGGKFYSFSDIKVEGHDILDLTKGKGTVTASVYVATLNISDDRNAAIQGHFAQRNKNIKNFVAVDTDSWLDFSFSPRNFNDQEWKELRRRLMRAKENTELLTIEGGFGVFSNTLGVYFSGTKILN